MHPEVTQLARDAFQRGWAEARRLNHGAVRAEHILLGVLQLSAGSASEALDDSGVDRMEWRRQVEALLPPPEEPAHEGEYPYHASGNALLMTLFRPDSASPPERITSGRVLLELARLGTSSIAEATQRAGIDRRSLMERLSAEPEGSE